MKPVPSADVAREIGTSQLLRPIPVARLMGRVAVSHSAVPVGAPSINRRSHAPEAGCDRRSGLGRIRPA